MLGNIVDHRTDRTCPQVDAVFEPSAHDSAQRPDGTFHFDMAELEHAPNAFHVLEAYNTTVREAVLRAEREWSFAVTVFLYDQGSRPVG
ncbi:hypothetical protein M446_1505 [Methylobacterium sp. 4-46]|uniref:hypothetical protein n=1 Tax=unclassified Methylobacterium TaxID=2615210 RepID=UPI000152E197|nr:MULTISPECIES: hypothetical protein [Methylobacterium]ACA16010.1 hypothetical protein M446_1505 [Methylobacterium sp. 4-46]WFT81724.1 hypothetical protein QA634_07635 [Methylobacterium nodulans]